MQNNAKEDVAEEDVFGWLKEIESIIILQAHLKFFIPASLKPPGSTKINI